MAREGQTITTVRIRPARQKVLDEHGITRNGRKLAEVTVAGETVAVYDEDAKLVQGGFRKNVTAEKCERVVKAAFALMNQATA